VLVCDREHGELARMISPVTGPVVACADLEEALRASTRQSFDIAFVGVREHTETFVGLLQLLRRTLPRTPIILVLEDPSPAARLATLTVRPFYVVVPPVSFDELDAVLADALAAARRAS
jgi:DNA-binding NtrC family response regulator